MSSSARPVLLLAIGLSVALNFFLYWSGPAGRPPVTVPGTSFSLARFLGLPVEAPKARIRKQAPARDPRMADEAFVRGRLKAEGFPDHLAFAILSSVASEGRASAGLSREQSRKRYHELVQEFGTARQKESIRLDQQRLYGDLPDEKIAAIEAIQGGPRIPGVESNPDAGKEARILALLTPEEAMEYLRFNSLAAVRVQQAFSTLDLAEHEYVRLVDSAMERDAARPGSGDPSRLNRRADPLSIAGLREVHDVLGDTRFLAFLASPYTGPGSRGADGLYTEAQLPDAKRVALYFRGQEYLWWLQAAEDAGSPPAPAVLKSRSTETFQAIVREAGFSADQVARFKQTQLGRQLARNMEDQETVVIRR